MTDKLQNFRILVHINTLISEIPDPRRREIAVIILPNRKMFTSNATDKRNTHIHNIYYNRFTHVRHLHFGEIY